MISCTINGKKRSFDIDPTKRLREMLLMNGNFAVRDSDDAEGFCGSDTVLLDGTPEEVFSRPDVLLAAGLDVPQSAALVHGLRELGFALPGKVGTTQDCIDTVMRAYASSPADKE